MRKKSSARRKSNALGLAFFVGSLVALLILAALVIKILLIFSHSKFDGKHQFVLEIREPSIERFVVFNPDNASVRMLTVTGRLTNNPLADLGIPVDGLLSVTHDIASPSDITWYLLLHSDNANDSLTIVDAINLFVFVHTSDISAAPSQTVTLKEDPSTVDTAITKIFVDTTLYNQGESIAVVNGTTVSGLGSEVGRTLTHVGGNVISITTAVNPISSSSVGYTGKSTYTAQRLANILHLPLAHLSSQSISDITVTVGLDRAKDF